MSYFSLTERMPPPRNPNGPNRRHSGRTVARRETSTLEDELERRVAALNPREPFRASGELGRTILHLAAYAGRVDIVRDLLHLPGAASYIDTEDLGGKTAIALAREYNHHEVVNLLEAAQRTRAT